MTPEVGDHLAASERALAKAAAMMAFPMHDEAGRQAYYAMFHAAHALVVARGFRPPKTHRGLRQLFARIAHTEDATIRELVGPLTNSYQLKWIADYDTTATTVSAAEAQAAIDDATRFLGTIRVTLAPPPP